MGEIVFVGGFDAKVKNSAKKISSSSLVNKKHPFQALEYIESRSSAIDAVVMSLRMNEMNGLDAMEKVYSVDSQIPVIISTSDTSLSVVVDAMKRGAFNYIYEPDEPKELPFLLERAIAYRNAIRENRSLRKAKTSVHEFIGISSAAATVREVILKAANSSLPVLITGESGTGKEIAARSLHNLSPRSRSKFVAVNCGALSPTLLEAELFGYTKGSFTGADRNHKGLFEQAHKGTLFLDEIGTTESSFQVRLLRAIEEGEIRRIGDEESRKVDVRIIAASNISLEQMIKKGSFRKDLFYRLNVINLTIPPLRKRKDDISILARYFLDQVLENKPDAPGDISPQAIRIMEQHSWPGNGRELRNAVLRASVMAHSDKITPCDLPAEITAKQSASRMNNEYTFIEAVHDFESSLILGALEETNGNKAEAARVLGIKRTTLVEKMRRLEIEYIPPEL